MAKQEPELSLCTCSSGGGDDFKVYHCAMHARAPRVEQLTRELCLSILDEPDGEEEAREWGYELRYLARELLAVISGEIPL